MEKDYAKAMTWYRKVAARGDEKAKKYLEDVRARGNGFEADIPLDYLRCCRCYRHVDPDMMPEPLNRGDARFTDPQTLFLAGCSAYGWDKNGRWRDSPVCAVTDATEEGYAVWFSCSNNLCLSESKLEEKEVRDYVYEDRIVEHVYDVSGCASVWSIGDEALAFVKIPKRYGIYMFYGIIKCVNTEYEDYRGIKDNHMICTFELISCEYPDFDLDSPNGMTISIFTD